MQQGDTKHKSDQLLLLKSIDSDHNSLGIIVWGSHVSQGSWSQILVSGKFSQYDTLFSLKSSRHLIPISASMPPDEVNTCFSQTTPVETKTCPHQDRVKTKGSGRGIDQDWKKSSSLTISCTNQKEKTPTVSEIIKKKDMGLLRNWRPLTETKTRPSRPCILRFEMGLETQQSLEL